MTSVGNITESGVLSIGGTATFTPGAGNSTTLNTAANDFSTVVVANGLNAAFQDANAIDLGAITITGALSVSSAGNISESGVLSIGGATTLTASAALSDIDVSTQANVFGGAITVTNNGNVRDLLIRNASGAAGIPSLPAGMRNLTLIWNSAGLVLPALTLTGTLSVTTGGDITESGRSVAGLDLHPRGGGNSTTLNTSANNFSTVVVTNGLNAAFQDSNAIILGAITITGTLDVTSAGNITESAVLSIGGALRPSPPGRETRLRSTPR